MCEAPADAALIGAEYAGARIVTPNPYVYFARAAQYFAALHEIKAPPGIHPGAFVDASAQVDASASVGVHAVIEAGAIVGAGCVIGPGCVVGRDAVIGAGTQLLANVTFHARCVIGQRGIIHSGAVIGTDGFGFANDCLLYTSDAADE